MDNQAPHFTALEESLLAEWKPLSEWADTDPRKWWPNVSEDFISGYMAAQTVARSLIDPKSERKRR